MARPWKKRWPYISKSGRKTPYLPSAISWPRFVYWNGHCGTSGFYVAVYWTDI